MNGLFSSLPQQHSGWKVKSDKYSACSRPKTHTMHTPWLQAGKLMDPVCRSSRKLHAPPPPTAKSPILPSHPILTRGYQEDRERERETSFSSSFIVDIRHSRRMEHPQHPTFYRGISNATTEITAGAPITTTNINLRATLLKTSLQSWTLQFV
jgi:hypothetical protein